MIHLSHTYMSTHERFIQLWTMYTTTLSDGEITKTKVVDLDEFYNFVVDDFFIWNHWLLKNSVGSSHIFKFKFWIVQIKLDGEMIKINVVDLDDLYNFVFDNFFIWNHLVSKILFEVVIF